MIRKVYVNFGDMVEIHPVHPAFEPNRSGWKEQVRPQSMLVTVDGPTTISTHPLLVQHLYIDRPKHELEETKEDAAKWQALVRSDRIRVMGHTHDLNHVGIEFWRNHPEAHPSKNYPQEDSRALLERYVAEG